MRGFGLNNRGMGLIDVLVSTAMLGFLSLIMNNVIMTGLKGAKTAQFNVEIASLYAEVQNIVANKRTCGSAFAGAGSLQFSGDPTPIGQIFRSGANATAVATVGQDIIPGLEVTSIAIERAKDVALGSALPGTDNSPLAGQTSYWVEINIEVERRGSFGPARKQLRPILFNLVTETSTGDVIKCESDVETYSVPTPGIRFQWELDPELHDGVSTCPTGYVDLEIIDDLNTFHDMGSSQRRGETKRLCAIGISGAEWVDNDDGCSPGYVDTRIEDNYGGLHALYESSNLMNSCRQRLCLKGIREAKWVAQCELGWTSTTIYSNGVGQTDRRCMVDSYEVGNFATVLCVR